MLGRITSTRNLPKNALRWPINNTGWSLLKWISFSTLEYSIVYNAVMGKLKEFLFGYFNFSKRELKVSQRGSSYLDRMQDQSGNSPVLQVSTRSIQSAPGSISFVPLLPTSFDVSLSLPRILRGTQREYSSKPLKHSILERILVFKR